MRRLNRRGFTLVELMVVVAILSILVSIAIPNFMQMQTRVKQSEAKMNLKAIFTTQRAFFQHNDRYATTISELGFSPERGNRYAYRLASWGTLQLRNAPMPAPGYHSGVSIDVYAFTDPEIIPEPAPEMGIASPNAGTTGPYRDSWGTAHFLTTATSNIDQDAQVDTWWLSTESFPASPTPCTAAAVFNVAGGVPFNSNDDVACE